MTSVMCPARSGSRAVADLTPRIPMRTSHRGLPQFPRRATLRRIMKTFLKVLLGFAVLVIVGVAVVFYATGNMVKTADAFFVAVKAHDYPKAMSLMSAEFRASTSPSAFVAFVETSALPEFKSVSWGSRSAAPGKGELEGVVTTESGGAIPLKLGLVKENGEWRIYAIRKDKAGVDSSPVAAAPTTVPAPAPVAPVVPAAPTASPAPDGTHAPVGTAAAPLPEVPSGRFLVKVTMAKIAGAIKTGDMRSLVGSSRSPAESEAAVQRFAAALKAFGDRNVDLTPLIRQEPVIKGKPAVDASGALVIAGNYPSKNAPVVFRFSYVGNSGHWELDSIALSER